MWLHLLLLVLYLSSCLGQTIGVNPQAENENIICTTPDHKSGICVNVISCPSLKKVFLTDVQNLTSPKFLRESQCHHSFEGNLPVVCCPDQTSTFTVMQKSTTATVRTTTKESREDVNYGECGKSNKKAIRIVGGVNATLGDWPWMVALGFRSKISQNLDFKCGASLISNKWVITAAHCVQNTRSFKLTTVRLGDLDLDPDIHDGATPIEEEIDQIISHPEYTTNPIVNDIALLRLKNTVQFSKHIRPICLLSGSKYRSDPFYNQKTPFIVGWGAIQWRGATSSRLQEAMIRIVNSTDCANIYATQSSAKIDHRIVCAGAKDKDTCQGDSGGPLIFPINTGDQKFVYYLGGIVSFGIRCADNTYPGVYTRIAAFTDWISETTDMQISDLQV